VRQLSQDENHSNRDTEYGYSNSINRLGGGSAKAWLGSLNGAAAYYEKAWLPPFSMT
jgi:hypothetical protein